MTLSQIGMCEINNEFIYKTKNCEFYSVQVLSPVPGDSRLEILVSNLKLTCRDKNKTFLKGAKLLETLQFETIRGRKICLEIENYLIFVQIFA